MTIQITMHNSSVSYNLLGGFRGNFPGQSSIITAKKEQLYLETPWWFFDRNETMLESIVSLHL